MSLKCQGGRPHFTITLVVTSFAFTQSRWLGSTQTRVARRQACDAKAEQALLSRDVTTKQLLK